MKKLGNELQEKLRTELSNKFNHLNEGKTNYKYLCFDGMVDVPTFDGILEVVIPKLSEYENVSIYDVKLVRHDPERFENKPQDGWWYLHVDFQGDGDWKYEVGEF